MIKYIFQILFLILPFSTQLTLCGEIDSGNAIISKHKRLEYDFCYTLNCNGSISAVVLYEDNQCQVSKYHTSDRIVFYNGE
jgi:hypothetical protein